MQATKYDYNALKLEYFMSNIDEIKWFRIDKGLRYNSRVATMTKWRWQEKQERKNKIVEKALERKKNEIARKLEIPVEDLFEIKKTAIDLMKKKLDQMQLNSEIPDALDGETKATPINVKDLETIRKVAKTELWEPSTVSENKWTFDANVSMDWPLVSIVRSDEIDDDEE